MKVKSRGTTLLVNHFHMSKITPCISVKGSVCIKCSHNNSIETRNPASITMLYSEAIQMKSSTVEISRTSVHYREVVLIIYVESTVCISRGCFGGVGRCSLLLECDVPTVYFMDSCPPPPTKKQTNKQTKQYPSSLLHFSSW